MFSVLPEDANGTVVGSHKDRRRTPGSRQNKPNNKYSGSEEPPGSDVPSPRFLEKPVYSTDMANGIAVPQHSEERWFSDPHQIWQAQDGPYRTDKAEKAERMELIPQPPEHQPAWIYIREVEQSFQKQFNEHTLALKQLLTDQHMGLLEAVQRRSTEQHSSLLEAVQSRSAATAERQCECKRVFLDGPQGNDLAVIPGTIYREPLEAGSLQAEHTVSGNEIRTHSQPSISSVTREISSSSLNGQLLPTPMSKSSLGSKSSLCASGPSFLSSLDEEKDEKTTALKGQWDEYQRESIRKIVSHSQQQHHKKWMRILMKRLRPDRAPSNFLARITQGKVFQCMTGTAILLNSIVIGWETDEGVRAAVADQQDPGSFGLVNNMFTAFFVVELTTRILGEQCWFFVGPEWKWNLFDCVLVFHSLIQEVLEGANMSFARILRAVRMVRAARIIRVLRFFHELRRMVCSIMASMMSLLWAFVLLVLIMYLVAICFCQAVTTYLKGENLHAEAVEGIEQWYSSLTMAIFSLMLSISGGADWYDICFPLTKISPIYTIAYLLYVFFVIFGVLNVLVGVFLASAAELLDKDIIVQSEMMKNNAQMKEMLSLFEEIDSNNTGTISWVEFQSYLQDEKAQAFFQYNCFDTSDPHALFTLMDVNGDDAVDSQEFIMAMMKIKGQAKGSDMLSLVQESTAAKEKLQQLMYATQAQQAKNDEDMSRILRAVSESHSVGMGGNTLVTSGEEA